jgi:hypothetical protein
MEPRTDVRGFIPTLFQPAYATGAETAEAARKRGLGSGPPSARAYARPPRPRWIEACGQGKPCPYRYCPAWMVSGIWRFFIISSNSSLFGP